ncbi:ead/Ea22-like family protein [Klebsiella pneumoniae]|uniref:ead/Ea22-like family protein n=1 Tax=Klebsiella pneumoniae TaxID=573 RepID=UPI001CA4A934|nr:ead/Ea22-like family protein [Klebsiella pneumoniae]
MTDITELAQRLKAAADREMICRDVAETSEIWERTVTPVNILALVEALESEKRICATWRKTAEANSEKLEKAQTINAAAEKLVRCKGRYHSEQNYRALAALFGVTTPDLPPLEHENVHYADAAEMEIAALRQRIAELESRTVKLPDDEDGQAYGFGKWANGKLPATAGTMTIAYCEDAWRAAFEVFSSAAGIKVEAE